MCQIKTKFIILYIRQHYFLLFVLPTGSANNTALPSATRVCTNFGRFNCDITFRSSHEERSRFRGYSSTCWRCCYCNAHFAFDYFYDLLLIVLECRCNAWKHLLDAHFHSVLMKFSGMRSGEDVCVEGQSARFRHFIFTVYTFTAKSICEYVSDKSSIC